MNNLGNEQSPLLQLAPPVQTALCDLCNASGHRTNALGNEMDALEYGEQHLGDLENVPARTGVCEGTELFVPLHVFDFDIVVRHVNNCCRLGLQEMNSIVSADAFLYTPNCRLTLLRI